jgi:hypothetical protein
MHSNLRAKAEESPDLACRTRGSHLMPAAVGAIVEKTQKTMNTQDTTSDIAANALATLAAALDAGNRTALTAYLNVTARFHRYSWTSCLLIAIQRSNATRVAGFRTWLGSGRHVRKRRKRNRHSYADPISTKAKRITRSTRTTTPPNQVATSSGSGVYSYSTFADGGARPPEFASVKGNPAQHLERLKATIASHSVILEYNTSIAPAKGASRGENIYSAAQPPGGKGILDACSLTADEQLHHSDGRANATRRFARPKAKRSLSSFPRHRT